MANSITENINRIKQEIGDSVSLVAVSKTKPNELIQEAYDGGHRIFGENKVQELARKYEELPKDIVWHMIGHLQSNKVKYIAPFVSLIHAVDSLKLLREINKQATKNNRTIDCLLQLKIASEESKFGLTYAEAQELLIESSSLGYVRVVGVMGMATNTSDEQQIRNEFAQLKKAFSKLEEIKPAINIISMGMTGDYRLAIEEGSNMIRVGSAIFGARN